jgi:hypothetical protein
VEVSGSPGRLRWPDRRTSTRIARSRRELHIHRGGFRGLSERISAVKAGAIVEEIRIGEVARNRTDCASCRTCEDPGDDHSAEAACDDTDRTTDSSQGSADLRTAKSRCCSDCGANETADGCASALSDLTVGNVG